MAWSGGLGEVLFLLKNKLSQASLCFLTLFRWVLRCSVSCVYWPNLHCEIQNNCSPNPGNIVMVCSLQAERLNEKEESKKKKKIIKIKWIPSFELRILKCTALRPKVSTGMQMDLLHRFLDAIPQHPDGFHCTCSSRSRGQNGKWATQTGVTDCSAAPREGHVERGPLCEVWTEAGLLTSR